MKIVLVGADLEENIGVGMVAAVAEAAGHRVAVVPCNEAAAVAAAAARIEAAAPHVVGLSIQFQHRAGEFLALSRRLRSLGYGGHITCGGQFPSQAWREVLTDHNGVDSVVLHDGEETFAALLGALERGRELDDVPGLALVGAGGVARRTPARPLQPDLDRYPFPSRYRPHTRHVGVPFVPILGSRGCWGGCSFCSIVAGLREARARGGGRKLRQRSPGNLAAEMALRWHAVGGKAVFCLHDDSLLLPRPADSLRRLRALRSALDGHGVGQVAMVGKCRPDTLTADLAVELRKLGVVRLFVGVENASQRGSDHLGRGVPVELAHRAVEACRQAGIFCCYNLLVFEPRATLDDVQDNIDFLRRHPYFPANFCRAEAYHGTTLQQDLARRGALRGSYLGYDYRLQDDRAELLFRICAAAFRERNYARRGVHNRYMGLGYCARLLEFFHAERGGRRAALVGEAEQLTRSIVLESASFLQEALDLARQVDLADRDLVERETALLGLRVAAADRYQHARLDHVFDQMQAFTEDDPAPVSRRPPRGLVQAIQRAASTVAVAGLLFSADAMLSGCGDREVPTDAGAPDRDIWPTDDAPHPPHPDVHFDSAPDGIWPTDDAPHPPDIWPTDDAPHPDLPPGDLYPPLPDMPDLHIDLAPADMGTPGPDVGPPPTTDGGTAALLPGDDAAGQWSDSGPRVARRSLDLPLFAPPSVSIQATAVEGGARLRLCCAEDPITLRWEGDGRLEGEGPEVTWLTDSATDQVRVGVRSLGGVAVAALRAVDIPGRG